ncbi:uncharacterized protein ARMOST_15193 [Armillaria ostoyae]|uniref:Uncharacterized protein n=1 Tax=Armillaria ostoyae TaxID=47428 RepID=A0A284RSP5_ARMOS|nr:uncharacterized protein ARMOST_15193 [Armillaria ostoyae]
MLSLPGVAAASASPPFLPYTNPYSVATTSQSSSPLFSMSRNPTASSFLTWDHTIIVKWATRPPRPSLSSYQCPVPSDHPETIGLDIDGCHAAIDDTCNAHTHRAQIMGGYFFYF